MGCFVDGGDNIQIEKNVMPSVMGGKTPSIVRVATRYRWEQVRLPRNRPTYVIIVTLSFTLKVK